MSTITKISYYNTFWNKKVVTQGPASAPGLVSYWPGLPWNPAGYPTYPNDMTIVASDYERNWMIEESRIVGGYNNTTTDLGVRAYINEETINQRHRFNSLIYSGVYNANTGVNSTNVFSVSENISKSIDPSYGEIKRTVSYDTNLIILQESKVSQSLIDKDTIYTSEDGTATSPPGTVLGQTIPYVGEFGIGNNPESFADFGMRKYFADPYRGSILRLSRDGLTEISQYGMKDYFRDELSKISDRTQVYSPAFPVKYDLATGLIEQGPSQPLESGITTSTSSPLGPWLSLDTEAINQAGLDTDDIIIGSRMQINLNYPDGQWVNTSSFIDGIGSYNSEETVYISLSGVPIFGANLNPYVRFFYYEKDKIEGGFDNYKDNYIVSLQKHSGSKTLDETSDYYSTLTFDETVQGWTTFYTYRPGTVLSMKNNMFTTKYGVLYKHYDASVDTNNFYGVQYPSNITFVFNANPGLSKNFKTVAYEGSDGWQIDSFVSDVTGNILPVASEEIRDTTNPVKSYQEGLYIEGGIPYRVGFNRKDNKYVANLINNSPASPGEVNFGKSITGIKGFFSIVTMSTDTTTNKGGTKELFAVSTEFAVSPR